MSATFKNRLIEAMSIRNITAAQLSKLTGLSKPRISQYVNGVYEAKQEALYKLAKALDVSEAWLMGFDANIERVTAEDLKSWDEKYNSDEISKQAHIFEVMQKTMPDVYELLMEYNDLNEEGKKQAILRIKELTYIPEYKKESGE